MDLLITISLIVAFVFAWIYFRGDSSSDGGEGINERHNDSDNDGGDSDGGDSDGGDGGGD